MFNRQQPESEANCVKTGVEIEKLSKVLNHLYLGSFEASQDRDLLKRAEIRDVLSVIDNPKKLHGDVNYLLVDIPDSPISHLDDHFDRSINFIHECRLSNRPVLVHW